MPTLNMSRQDWQKLCEYAEDHPTCKIILHQHLGEIKKITVEACLEHAHVARKAPVPLDNEDWYQPK